MASLDERHLVGTMNLNPYFGINLNPLDWKTLLRMNVEDREREIVTRANFYTWGRPLLRAMSRALMEAINIALENGDVSFEKPREAKQLDWKVHEMFPYTDKEKEGEEFVNDRREKYWPSANDIISHLDKNLDQFRKTLLCKRLTELVRRLFEKTSCCKVVAFGIGPLTTSIDPETAGCRRLFYQTASLIVFREVWKECHENSNETDFKIFLQDPLYWQQDVDAAQHYNMEVVNGLHGHQMGWLKIDQKTLVCDFGTTLRMCDFLMEFARPIAIFTNYVWDVEFVAEDEPYVYFLKKDKDDLPLPFPGAGTTRKKSHQKMNELYSRNLLNRSQLDVGFPETEKIPHADGGGGNNYLGGSPTLYIRKE
ncbi:hypothetical protein ONS96_014748 [Cadophora gregata f. sp. sojae]|nr:hypothetical protein ONS96_014748 [Cadophora gregata f. sp. sojae]